MVPLARGADLDDVAPAAGAVRGHRQALVQRPHPPVVLAQVVAVHVRQQPELALAADRAVPARDLADMLGRTHQLGVGVAHVGARDQPGPDLAQEGALGQGVVDGGEQRSPPRPSSPSFLPAFGLHDRGIIRLPTVEHAGSTGRPVEVDDRSGGGLDGAPVPEHDQVADRHPDHDRRLVRPRIARAGSELGTVPIRVLGGEIARLATAWDRELLRRCERRGVGGGLRPRGDVERLRQVRRAEREHHDRRGDRRRDDGDRPVFPIHPNSCRIVASARRWTDSGMSQPAMRSATRTSYPTETVTASPRPPSRCTSTVRSSAGSPGAAASAAERTAPSSGSTAASLTPARADCSRIRRARTRTPTCTIATTRRSRSGRTSANSTTAEPRSPTLRSLRIARDRIDHGVEELRQLAARLTLLLRADLRVDRLEQREQVQHHTLTSLHRHRIDRMVVRSTGTTVRRRNEGRIRNTSGNNIFTGARRARSIVTDRRDSRASVATSASRSESDARTASGPDGPAKMDDARRSRKSGSSRSAAWSRAVRFRPNHTSGIRKPANASAGASTGTGPRTPSTAPHTARTTRAPASSSELGASGRSTTTLGRARRTSGSDPIRLSNEAPSRGPSGPRCVTRDRTSLPSARVASPATAKETASPARIAPAAAVTGPPGGAGGSTGRRRPARRARGRSRSCRRACVRPTRYRSATSPTGTGRTRSASIRGSPR